MFRNNRLNLAQNSSVSRETLLFFFLERFMELLLSCLKAFLVGGAICLVGQVLIDFTKLTPARILVSFVVAGVLLTALGCYEPIVEFAGAGATVPLTGFGYSLAKGVKEAVEQYGLIGALSGGLSATSAGIAASVFAGLLMALLFKPGDKS
jgi:stage V sporulation protein AE